MRPRFASFVVSACVAASFAAVSQTQAQTVSVTITGRTLARDDAALPRVRVAAHEVDTNRLVQTVMTDAGGRFTLTVPADAKAELTLTKAGYAAQRIRPTGTPLDVRLVRGAVITGRVSDRSGEPAASVQVIARRLVDAGQDLSAPSVFSGDADDRGEYRIGGLPEGRYTLAPAPALVPPDTTPPAPVPEPKTFSSAAGDLVAGADFTVDVPRPGLPSVVTIGFAENATIQGRVTTTAGQPLAGALVRARRPGVPIRMALSDAQGRYSVSGLSPGEYIVDAQRTGYATRMYGEGTRDQGGNTVSVRSEQIVERIDIALLRPGAIEGAVVDEFGEPLQGAMVDVLQVQVLAGRPRARRLRARATDDLGRYRVFGLLPGSYVVRVQVSDAVTDSATQGYAPVYFPAATQIDQAARIELVPDRDAVNADIVVRPSMAVRVVGRAVDSSGLPVRGAIVLAISERSGAIQIEPTPARPDADGRFEFTNVPPGDYVIQANGPPLIGPTNVLAGMPEFAAQYVTITDAAPPPLLLKTSAGATVRGRFVFEGIPDPSSAAFTLIARPTDFDRAPMGGAGSTGFTPNEDGTFTYVRLHGPRQLMLNTAPAGWYLKSVMIKGRNAADEPFDFGAEPVTIADVEVVISGAGAAMTGRVTDDRGNAVTRYTVIVFPTERNKWYAGSRFMKFGSGSQDGSFRVAGLPPGDYWLVAVDRVDTEPGGEWQSSNLLETLVSRASRVTVGEGEVHSATLRVIRR